MSINNQNNDSNMFNELYINKLQVNDLSCNLSQSQKENISYYDINTNKLSYGKILNETLVLGLSPSYTCNNGFNVIPYNTLESHTYVGNQSLKQAPNPVDGIEIMSSGSYLISACVSLSPKSSGSYTLLICVNNDTNGEISSQTNIFVNGYTNRASCSTIIKLDFADYVSVYLYSTEVSNTIYPTGEYHSSSTGTRFSICKLN